MSVEKEISYTANNTYSTLNKLTPATKNVWIACHGLGYLSRYFIAYFNHLDAEENYIIAPQAPSKYYQGSDFKHVGASWLTKENTAKETNNIVNYMDAVYTNENIPAECNLIVMGYSQGVSVAMRWVAKQQINADALLIHSGGIPKELTAEDFQFATDTKVFHIFGTKDQYITEERIAYEKSRAEELFKGQVITKPFDGAHIVNQKILSEISMLYKNEKN